MRYNRSQVNQTLKHPSLPQPASAAEGQESSGNDARADESSNSVVRDHSQVLVPRHTFVVAADTQFGFIDLNRPRNADWKNLSEIEYSERAIQKINQMDPRPLFCCVCGDLVDMTSGIYAGTAKKDNTNMKAKPSEQEDATGTNWTVEECDAIQDVENEMFQSTWSALHPDIPLVCVCGNHDVGNQPTAASIQRFRDRFGDDHLAFWANGTYHIVLNTSLISKPDSEPELNEAQWEWVQKRLQYAQDKGARNIFVFGHHPWFLYNENEDENKLTGRIGWPNEFWGPEPPDFPGFPDSYFPIPREHRLRYLELFQKYNVTACFAGHYHQNLVTKTSFGMDMITTGPLSIVLQSSSNKHPEPATRGFRVVTVEAADKDGERGTFTHEYLSLD